MSRHSGRRSWFGILFGSKPSRYGRLLILFFLVVAAQAVVCLEIFRRAIRQIQLLDTPHPAAAIEIMHDLGILGMFFVVTIVALCAVCIYLVHHLTVNVMGAKQAILIYLEQLKTGKYEKFRKLRDGDELQDVLTSLEQFAEKLKSEKKN